MMQEIEAWGLFGGCTHTGVPKTQAVNTYAW